MATSKVLLREDLDNLGARGELVKVRAGYARNYLIPQGFAMEATRANLKQVERERATLLKKAASEKAGAEAQAGQLQGLNLKFERRAGEHGILFGSVTSMDIAEAIQAKGYEIDRRKITLKEPIKELGDYTVSVKLHREVSIEIPVQVVGEDGQTAAPKTVEPEVAPEVADETTTAE